MGPSSWAEEPREVALARLSEVSPVSADFRARTAEAAGTIPSGVWRRLKDGGWQVRMAAFVVDADPSLRGIQPRGWPDGTTWEHTDAVHLPAKRLLVFAEKRRNREGQVVDSTRVENVLRHEVGHAFDRALGGDDYYSSGTTFISAYFRDLARMAAEDRGELQYYLQRGPAGRQEAFAESFAIILGGGSASHRESSFTRSFPRVLEQVREVLQRHEEPRLARLPIDG
ncbi:hypothetical protein Pla8534_29060 [Lignipirellula cremea]|uniref:Anthrax toxin lethal/endema factor N-/C-terminal domain-containing protein n=2 Tax=Lignipirellula cremea TaxID=2528010 RepID=A0A518DTD9_9BACT|nr:hypothetical protein Pla8534_29060 [Lignipirellula cremea]